MTSLVFVPSMSMLAGGLAVFKAISSALQLSQPETKTVLPSLFANQPNDPSSNTNSSSRYVFWPGSGFFSRENRGPGQKIAEATRVVTNHVSSIDSGIHFYDPGSESSWDALLNSEDPVCALVFPHFVKNVCHKAMRLDLKVLIGVAPVGWELANVQSIRGAFVASGVSKENLEYLLVNEGVAGGLSKEFVAKKIGPIRFANSWKSFPLLASENQNCGATLVDILSKPTASVFDQWIKAVRSPDVSPFDLIRFEEKIRGVLWNAYSDSSDKSLFDLSAEINRCLVLENVSALEPDVFNALCERAKDNLFGLGPLEKYLRDPLVNEIMVNGTRHLFVERDGVVVKEPVCFDSSEQLDVIISKVVSRIGRRVDTSSPVCDARLEDGSRVNVVLPPLSIDGPMLTIRRFRRQFHDWDALLQNKTLTPDQRDVLIQAVEAKKNILVAGNSGSGKTTLLNVLTRAISPAERIITIEDAAELQPCQDHVVRLETRPANSEGIGAFGAHDLLVNALRMRPDRLILGECRGAETLVMIQAMNTGHNGSMATLHANSAPEALQRLEAMILMAAPGWPISVIREQIASSIDMILFMTRSNGVRRLSEIGLVKRNGGTLCVTPA